MTIGGIWDYYGKKVGYGEIAASELRGKAVSTDISVFMHRQRAVCKKDYLKRINPFSTDVDNDAIDKVWLARVLRQVMRYLTLGFLPIVVFDGKKSKLKMDNAGVKRSKPVASAEEQLGALREKHAGRDPLLIPASDQALARTLLERVDRMPNKSVQKCKTLFQDLGIPWVQSKGEAERTCSLMNRQGLVAAVISVDGDCLAFGAQLILREEKDIYDSEGFGSTGFVTAEIEPLLDSVGMDFSLFQQLCIMAGTDFNQNMKGISFNKAIPLLRQHKSIARLSKVMDTTILNYEQVKKEFEIVDWKETAESWSLRLEDDTEMDLTVLSRYGMEAMTEQLANGKRQALNACGEWLEREALTLRACEGQFVHELRDIVVEARVESLFDPSCLEKDCRAEMETATESEQQAMKEGREVRDAEIKAEIETDAVPISPLLELRTRRPQVAVRARRTGPEGVA